jgi:hypothetical protein
MKDGSKPELLSPSEEQEASVAEHEIDALGMNMGGVVRGYYSVPFTYHSYETKPLL